MYRILLRTSQSAWVSNNTISVRQLSLMPNKKFNLSRNSKIYYTITGTKLETKNTSFNKKQFSKVSFF